MADNNKVQIIIEGKDTTKAMFNSFGNNLGAAEKQIGMLGGGLSSFTKALGAPINPARLLAGAVTGAAAGFSMLINKSIDSADQLNKMSQKVGVSVESLSTLKYAAELADVPIELLEGSLEKFNRTIFAATEGTNEQAKAFEQLGIKIKNNDGSLRDTDKMLLDVAEKFAGMNDGVTKTAIAMKLFGKSGADMIPFLNAGKDGIKAMTDEAKALGLELSTSTAQAAETFNDNITRLEGAVTGLANQGMTALMPMLLAVSDGLLDVGKNANQVNPIIEVFAGGLKTVATAVIGVIGPAMIAGETIGILGATMARFAIGDTPGAIVAWQTGLIDLEKHALTLGETLAKIWATPWDPAKGNVGTKPGSGDIPPDGKDKAAAKAAADAEKAAAAKDAKDAKDYSARVDKRQKEAADFLEFMNATHTQFDTDWAAMQGEALDKAQQSGFDFFAAQLEAQRAAAEEQIALDKMVADSKINALSNMGNAMLAFSNLSTNQNKYLFAMYKATSIALAIINTHTGMTKALGTKGIWGILEAAAIFAFGMAQVATIASTQPGSTGGGGGGSRTSTSTPSAPTSNASNNNTQTVTHTTQIVIYGSVVDHDKFARDLVPSIEKAVADGASKLVMTV